MKEISYLDALRETNEHLAKGGVFLNVAGDKPNTMTIGWASLGNVWARPVMMVMVRRQRHSYEMLRMAGEFTVSVPTGDSMRAQLAFAGTASGRDVDKFSGHGITAAPAQAVSAPIIKECGLHFECKTMYTQDMADGELGEELTQKIYPAKDYHVLFFGEIIRCYRTDGD